MQHGHSPHSGRSRSLSSHEHDRDVLDRVNDSPNSNFSDDRGRNRLQVDQDDDAPQAGSSHNCAPSVYLYVGKLSARTTDESFLRAFNEENMYPAEHNIVLEPITKMSRQFAFCKFNTVAECENAFKNFSGKIDGADVKLEYSKRRGPHAPTPGAYCGPQENSITYRLARRKDNERRRQSRGDSRDRFRREDSRNRDHYRSMPPMPMYYPPPMYDRDGNRGDRYGHMPFYPMDPRMCMPYPQYYPEGNMGVRHRGSIDERRGRDGGRRGGRDRSRDRSRDRGRNRAWDVDIIGRPMYDERHQYGRDMVDVHPGEGFDAPPRNYPSERRSFDDRGMRRDFDRQTDIQRGPPVERSEMYNGGNRYKE